MIGRFAVVSVALGLTLGGCANSTRVPSVQVPGQAGSPAIGTFHGPDEVAPSLAPAAPRRTVPPVTRYTPLPPAAQ